MLRILLATFSATLLIPSGDARACAGDEEEDDFVSVGSFLAPSVLPPSGMLYLRASLEAPFIEQTAEVRDPQGNPVDWDFVDLDFPDGAVGVVPQDGWRLGTYTGGLDSSQGVFVVVGTSEDSSEPEVSIESWERIDPSPFPSPYGCGGVEPRLELRMDDRAEPLLYSVEAEHLGPEQSGVIQFVSFYPSFSVPVATGDEVHVTVTGVDFAGNRSTVELEPAQQSGCAGSSGSDDSRGGESELVLALLIGIVPGLLRLRRRTERSLLP